MTLHLLEPDQKIEMLKNSEGYFQVTLDDIAAGRKYFFMPNGEKDLPDPASHFQPETVHGPSAVVDHNTFSWTDHSWKGIPRSELIIYELHVGTFTKEGTFAAIVPRLSALKDIGINAIEIMPVAQFPGKRNWGYDGVFPYSVQNSYGGPNALKQLVNEAHEAGIAIILDVVYNHIGPEGNYFSMFGPYFTRKYSTPWGEALNFDDEYSDGVREYFCNNAIHWLDHYHLDGLRLDAIHMAYDNGAVHFWQMLNRTVQEYQSRTGRIIHMIAESDLNSPKVVDGIKDNGFGFNVQWLDDFHHALYVMLDEKGKKRYEDFGDIAQVAKAYTDGFVHSGEYVFFRKRKHGASSAHISGDKFVAFNLNHDQVGNRPLGERLCVLVNEERLKVAAGALMIAPYIPMLFMGEEYADRSPFYYFVSHSDSQLIEAVRRGRKEEFKNFADHAEPPDAQSEQTYIDSKLKWEKRDEGSHKIILEWHKQLIKLRKTSAALKTFSKADIRVNIVNEKCLLVYRRSEDHLEHLAAFINFSDENARASIPFAVGEWEKIIDSHEPTQTLEKVLKVQSHESIEIQPISFVIYRLQV